MAVPALPGKSTFGAMINFTYFLKAPNENRRSGSIAVDVVTGNSEEMLFEAVKVINQYGLEFHTGLPHHQGRVRVVMYDEYH